MNIYLCLGFPWFLKNAISGPILINGHHFHTTVYMTIAVVGVVVFLMAINKFKMNYYMGVELILVYLVFCIYEYIKL